MYFVYIIECIDGSFYTGSTTDVDKRFKRHSSGRGSKYIRSKLPIKLVYREELQTKSEALKREIEIKKWSRVKKIDLIAGIAQW